jgi:hypothetical protein
LTLSVLRLDRPLLCLLLPDASLGGGKTRLRGVDPHLYRRLKRFASEFGHQILHPHFRTTDNIPVWRVVDHRRYLLKNLTGFGVHSRNELFGIHSQQPFHG